MLLNPSEREWRFSVGEVPDAIGCGGLSDLPSDAPFEEARDRLREILRTEYAVDVPPERWQPMEGGGWGADLDA